MITSTILLKENDIERSVERIKTNITLGFNVHAEVNFPDIPEGIKVVIDTLSLPILDHVKYELKTFNPYNDPSHGFSEAEVQILMHRILQILTVDFDIKEVFGLECKFGLTQGESLPFESIHKKKQKYQADTVLQVFESLKDYIPLILLEAKAKLSDENSLQKGEEEIIKYSFMITYECELNFLYGILVGIDSYILYKYNRIEERLDKQERKMLGLPKTFHEDEQMSEEFKVFLCDILTLIWCSFLNNYKLGLKPKLNLV